MRPERKMQLIAVMVALAAALQMYDSRRRIASLEATVQSMADQQAAMHKRHSVEVKQDKQTSDLYVKIAKRLLRLEKKFKHGAASKAGAVSDDVASIEAQLKNEAALFDEAVSAKNVAKRGPSYPEPKRVKNEGGAVQKVEHPIAHIRSAVGNAPREGGGDDSGVATIEMKNPCYGENGEDPCPDHRVCELLFHGPGIPFTFTCDTLATDKGPCHGNPCGDHNGYALGKCVVNKDNLTHTCECDYSLDMMVTADAQHCCAEVTGIECEKTEVEAYTYTGDWNRCKATCVPAAEGPKDVNMYPQ